MVTGGRETHFLTTWPADIWWSQPITGIAAVSRVRFNIRQKLGQIATVFHFDEQFTG